MIALFQFRIYKHFWHLDDKKLTKVAKWMNRYTSRQIAPQLFREDTGLASASGQVCGEEEKELEKGKVNC